ncbi:membrane-bound alkaline phosphatase-like [Hyposmocoma kahamanoa]|uniref:membrane-bound alkaline phosphatase-like n=1 Tax=Hyposmocoma kahamanoa TaxID=1477025 RepID=UPI000E6D6D87|nr:membrane-bound alkaline phosphatase-like [Hyposmocoma kahamanoa]
MYYLPLLFKLHAELNKRVAKNLILFLGDGMSITTLAATRSYLGQKYGHYGEEIKLSFEVFPFTGLAKTYCVNSNVADSACSGTAYLSGVKANIGTVGLSAAVQHGDCKSQKDGLHSVTGLMDWAQKAAKATGLVTTTRVTHATPAAAYAHSADRKWEADVDLKDTQCDDIAKQLVRGRVGSNIDIVLGGGRNNFLPTKYKDDQGYAGRRKDGANLIEEWIKAKNSLKKSPLFVYNKKQLLEIDDKKYNSVLGLFSADHMPYHLDSPDDYPTLTEMTTKAIKMLSSNDNGFFLFVEGGKIDMAHHETKARKALDETAEFAKAVEAALKMVDPLNTLIVVTSDHSHTMTYSGYNKRGSDILGLSRSNGTDKLPYTTLSYANGPGYKIPNNSQRHNLLLDNLKHVNYTYPSLVPLYRETHGGEDVAVFAKGPWSHLFSGNYEQNFIPHAIAYAACIGPGLTLCNSDFTT